MPVPFALLIIAQHQRRTYDEFRFSLQLCIQPYNSAFIAVHYGKLGGTMQTFILEAKLNKFVEVLGIYSRGLDLSKHVCHLSPFYANGRLLDPSGIQNL